MSIIHQQRCLSWFWSWEMCPSPQASKGTVENGTWVKGLSTIYRIHSAELREGDARREPLVQWHWLTHFKLLSLILHMTMTEVPAEKISIPFKVQVNLFRLLIEIWMLSELKEKWLEKFSLLKRASPYPHSSHILASLKLSERKKKKKKKMAMQGESREMPVSTGAKEV